MSLAFIRLSEFVASEAALDTVNLILDATFKGLIILLLAGVVTYFLRKASAAVRHWVWSMALCSLLFLPVLAALLPAWQLAVVPESISELALIRSEPAAPEIGTEVPGSSVEDPTQATSPPSTAPTAPSATQAPETSDAPVSDESVSIQEQAANLFAFFGTHWDRLKAEVQPVLAGWFPAGSEHAYGIIWLLFGWIIGALFVMGRLMLGVASVAWMSRRARPMGDGSWYALSLDVAGQYGISRRIRLRKSYQIKTPLTWGIFQPVVLLPADADTWTEDRRRVVLLHELAHVKRWDWLTQSLAHTACALYWFNPLVWIALRRLKSEHEKACDDQVLMAGAKASTYAEHLLALARTFWLTRWTQPVTVGMARKSELEGRMLAILNPNQRRRILKRYTLIVSGLVVACMLVPLAAMQLKTSDTLVEEIPAEEEKHALSALSTSGTTARASAVQAVGMADDKVCKELRETYPLGANGRVALENINGTVEITTWDQESVEIQAQKCAYVLERLDEAHIEIDADRNRISIVSRYDKQDLNWSDHPSHRERQSASIDYILRMPRSADLDKINLVNGDLSIRDLTGSVKAEAVNGEVLIEGLTGDVEVSTVNGRLHAQFDRIASRSSIKLSAVNGTIDVDLPEDADADVRANTVHGTIRSDFRFRVNRGRYVGRTLRGRLGDGDVPVRLENVNGSINIRRSDGNRSRNLQNRDREAIDWTQRSQRELQDNIAELHARDSRTREHAARALGELKDRRAVGPLMEAVHDSDPRVREQAVWALGELTDPQAADILVLAMDDQDERVQTRARQALQKLQRTHGRNLIRNAEDRSRSQYYEWSDEKKDEDVCNNDCRYSKSTVEFAQVAQSLGMAASDAGLDAARQALDDLKESLDELNIDLSVKMDDTKWQFQLESEDLDAVGQWLDRTVTNLATTVLKEVDWDEVEAEIRHESRDAIIDAQIEMLEALGEIPDAAGVPYLVRIAKNHTNREVRRTALSVLKTIDHSEARRALRNFRRR